ncbi:MAG: DNA cytosine methyltransferase [Pirellulales bacterium]
MTTVGSFCSGYGGLDLAVESFFDAKLSWWCDNAETPKQLMATHWPEAAAHHDLTELNPHDLEPVDIINAGFPCQPFSLAGYRRGNEDDRAIFSWIADSVGVVRPRYVFLENVAAITPWGGGIVGALTELGYDSSWGIIRASDASAPHQRARWFCLATDTTRSSEQSESESTSRLAWQSGRSVSGAVTDSDSERLQRHRTEHELREDRSEEAFGRDNSATANTERWAVQRQRRPSELAGTTRSPEQLRRHAAADSGQDAANTESAERGNTQHERVATPTESATESGECASEIEWGDYRPAIERWERVVGRLAPNPVDDDKLSPHFVEWMMGLPEGWVCDHIPQRNRALSCLGNGVVPQQAILALHLLTADES